MRNARVPTCREVMEIAQDLVRLHKLDCGSFNFLEGVQDEENYLVDGKENEEVLLKYALLVLDDRSILITDNYASDCPSYCGKTGVIFWGEICFVSVLTTDVNGRLQLMEEKNFEYVGGKN